MYQSGGGFINKEIPGVALERTFFNHKCYETKIHRYLQCSHLQRCKSGVSSLKPMELHLYKTGVVIIESDPMNSL